MWKKTCLSILVGFSLGIMAGELEIKPAAWKSRNVKVIKCTDTLKAEALNQDPILSFIPDKKVDCKEFCAITFELQIPVTTKGLAAQIFWNTTESKGIKETASTHVTLARDGKMHRYTAVLAGQPYWKGKLVELRFDPVAAQLPFTVGEVELKDSLEVTNWQGETIQKQEKDEVFGTFTDKTFTDPKIYASIPGKGLAAKEFSVLEFELALDSGCTPGGQLFWEGKGIKLSEKNSFYFSVPADSKFHKVTLNLTAKPEWKSTISRFRLDMTHKGVAGKNYRLKNFKLKSAK